MCLADFVPGEIITVLPCACGHKYHRTCIAVWLGRKNSCPLCCTQVRGTERSGRGIDLWLYSFYHFTISDMCSHCATLSWSSRRAMQRQMPTPQQEEKQPCLCKGEAVSHIHTHTYQRRGLTKTINPHHETVLLWTITQGSHSPPSLHIDSQRTAEFS